MGTWDTTQPAGVETVVAILNVASRSTEKHVIETIESRHPELAQEIKKRMFVFEDIVLLDAASTRGILERTQIDTVD